jgi:glycosyltransferase involved in cell wall biosynthesis
MTSQNLTQKHILLTSNTAWSIHNFRAAVVQGLLDAGFKVTVLAPKDKFSEVLAEMGCKCIDIKMDRNGLSPVKDLAFLIDFKRHVGKIQPDVIISYTIKNNIYGAIAARAYAIPFIAMIPGLGNAFASNNWLQKIAETLYRFAFKKVHKVLFLNQENRDVFVNKSLIDEARSLVMVGEGVDLDHFSFQQLPPCNEQRIFLFCARLLYDKGVGDFVTAARVIRTNYPAAQFHIVGKLAQSHRQGVSKETLAEWIDGDDIHYLGETNDVRPYIEAAHCVVLPSYYKEGMSRVLMEAAAIGRPIITTDMAGCRETIIDGETGYLFQARDVNSLGECLDRIMNLPPRQIQDMGAKSRRLAEDAFDEKDRVRSYLELLKHLF